MFNISDSDHQSPLKSKGPMKSTGSIQPSSQLLTPKRYMSTHAEERDIEVENVQLNSLPPNNGQDDIRKSMIDLSKITSNKTDPLENQENNSDCKVSDDDADVECTIHEITRRNSTYDNFSLSTIEKSKSTRPEQKSVENNLHLTNLLGGTIPQVTPRNLSSR
ncbi:unnamed protein product, partial [Didymodactylos carnosus]